MPYRDREQMRASRALSQGNTGNTGQGVLPKQVQGTQVLPTSPVFPRKLSKEEQRASNQRDRHQPEYEALRARLLWEQGVAMDQLIEELESQWASLKKPSPLPPAPSPWRKRLSTRYALSRRNMPYRGLP